MCYNNLILLFYQMCKLKLSNETGNVAFDMATQGNTGLRAADHVICLQHEFKLSRVIWLCVVIFFVKQFICLMCSINEQYWFLSKGVLSGSASDLVTVQWKLLENFCRSTETVFCQEPRFFGGLRHFQKEESR